MSEIERIVRLALALSLGEEKQPGDFDEAAPRIVKILADDGFVVVPRELTEAMYAAAKQIISTDRQDPHRNYADQVWRAMIDAHLKDK
jgi:hypothetical protein